MPQPMQLPPDPATGPGPHVPEPERAAPADRRPQYRPAPAGSAERAGRHAQPAAPPAAPLAPQSAEPSPSSAPRPRRPDEDSRGRPLAVRLPDWDLLPPTEFLDRPRRR